ncbi:MAG: phosphoglucosamine mutase [Christensenellales bacterium]
MSEDNMIFGTDGVRGEVDKGITTSIAYNIGKGLAISILKRKLNKKVVIGKDTRLTSDTYLSAIASGLTDYGINVVIVGIVPTPVISFLVSRFDFGGGIMITASHNDCNYNGIKVFSETGEKINNDIENEIEKNIETLRKKTKLKGKIVYDESLVNNYIDYLLSEFKCDLSEFSIALDCANGSNYKIAPYIYQKLNANVIKISCNNDGLKINKNCGANHIENLVYEVKCHNADFGIAFDGDGDRLRIVLKDGTILAGDDILLYFALYIKEKNKLNNLNVVGTIMTNLGIEDTLKGFGIKLTRTDVGDKNVIRMIKDKHLAIGGEPSGHICIYEHNPTCDALMNSLFFFKCYQEQIINLDDLMKTIIRYPSILQNISVNNDEKSDIISNSKIQNEIQLLKKENPDVKILVRSSGTEPVIRLYVESVSELRNNIIINKLLKIIKNKV